MGFSYSVIQVICMEAWNNSIKISMCYSVYITVIYISENVFFFLIVLLFYGHVFCFENLGLLLANEITIV